MTDTAGAVGLEVSGYAWAKVNLTLHVTGQRGDGYHLLDSLVVRVAVGDRLKVTPADQLDLVIDGPYAAAAPADARNLVIRAARLLDGQTGRGAKLHLTKMLPAQAGIGGGSADAATALRMLGQHWGVPIPQDLTVLGADVPVCIRDAPQRMRGVGDQVESVGPLPPCWLVLVNPNRSAATPDVFKRLESKLNAPMPLQLPVFAEAPAFAAWLGTQRNDLEQPARQVVPEIDACLAALPDALLARMSGSGATCFGLYESEKLAAHAAARIARDHPDWWVASGAVIS